MKTTAIIPASGIGKRMNSEVSKQYLNLAGKPVLFYALDAFEKSPVDEIILVVCAGMEGYVRETLIEPYQFTKVKKIVHGGAERSDSVYQGLLAAEDADYVLIHDAARPLVSADLIIRSIQLVQEYNAVIAAVAVKDTIKTAETMCGDTIVLQTLPRSTLWSIQTPQSFSYPLIRGAYEKYRESQNKSVIPVTDDASLVEMMTDTPIHILVGDDKNIKITTPEDLVFAAAYLDRIG